MPVFLANSVPVVGPAAERETCSGSDRKAYKIVDKEPRNDDSEGMPDLGLARVWGANGTDGQQDE